MKQRLILCLLTLALTTGACAPAGGGGGDFGCDTLVMVCGQTEHTIMVGIKDLSESVEGDTRHSRFWDCAMEEWVQSSCSADCTLELR